MGGGCWFTGRTVTLGPRLPKGGFGRVLDWHPDGARFLMQRWEQPGLPGRTLLVDALSAQTLTALEVPSANLASYSVTSASFSPDGDEAAVAYVDGNTGNSEVWLIALSGDGRLLAKTASQRIEWLDWSPRGEWIAMVTWGPGPGSTTWDYAAQLQLLHPDSGEQVPLAATVMAHGPAMLLAPQWDPQGTRLAFLAGSASPPGRPSPWRRVSTYGTPTVARSRRSRASPTGCAPSFRGRTMDPA